jgi:hypothetical protein
VDAVVILLATILSGQTAHPYPLLSLPRSYAFNTPNSLNTLETLKMRSSGSTAKVQRRRGALMAIAILPRRHGVSLAHLCIFPSLALTRHLPLTRFETAPDRDLGSGLKLSGFPV